MIDDQVKTINDNLIKTIQNIMKLTSLSNVNFPDIPIPNAIKSNISSLQQQTPINNNNNTNDTIMIHPLPD